MDNKNKDMNLPQFSLCINDRFYELFKDILPLFFLEPNKFIDLVGRDNFTEFAEAVVSHSSEEEIFETIDKMAIERESKIKYEVVGINIPLIQEAIKRKTERGKESPKELAHPQDRPIIIGRTSPRKDHNIFNDIEIIDNKNDYIYKNKKDLYYNIQDKINHFIYPNDDIKDYDDGHHKR